jgi:hypothetical protein
MGNSVLVFVSHSSDDKEKYIEPIVQDLEECYINVWFDKRKILPGDNLRKSIFREGLDKADIALVFFTEQSLQSSWVDREIKHVLREESKKGNDFDLNKIISIFDTKDTYKEISQRYPELTDDLLHLMPKDYSKKDLGQLISAIWSKYLNLHGGDVETQRQLLSKDKEIFQKEKEILELQNSVTTLKSKMTENKLNTEFQQFIDSGRIDSFIKAEQVVLGNNYLDESNVPELSNAMAFGLLDKAGNGVRLSIKGKDFFKWVILSNNQK